MTVATSWVDSVGGLAAVVNIAAVVVGGSWAYFKFAKGRTFAYRMETELRAALLAGNDARALDVTVELRNTGASRIPLSDVVKVAYVYGVQRSSWRSHASLDWGEQLRVVPIFERHEWVEAQEVISDEMLVPVPHEDGEEWLAYRIECMVASADRPRRRPLRWTAYTVVPAGLDVYPVTEEER